MTRGAALGRLGESLAAEEAVRRGYRVLDRNYRADGGELDLVLDDAGTLVVVEVKTRTTDGWGSGLESVTPRKIRRIVRATEAYLRDHALAGRPVRFDAVVATPPDREGEGDVTLEWLVDAFRP